MLIFNWTTIKSTLQELKRFKKCSPALASTAGRTALWRCSGCKLRSWREGSWQTWEH
jgi:hypothetical protein